MEYQIFKIKDHLETIKKLAVLDHEEVGEYGEAIPLDPDWDKYIALDAAGCLLCCGATLDGALVGYYISVVAPSLHSKNSLIAGCDALWLHPEHRGGTGVKLIKFHEQECKELNVSALTMNVTRHNDCSALLERLGWNQIETVFGKCIKEKQEV